MKSLHAKIWLVVFFIHFICLFLFASFPSKKKSPSKKLVVVTKEFIHKQKSPPIQIKTDIHKIPQISSIEKAKVKIPTPLKQKKSSPKTSKQILKKIEKRKPNSSLKPVKKPSSSQKTPLAESSNAYLETAFVIFRNLLILPEKGCVKLTLTVSPNGKIDKIIKESSESEKNLTYLLELLPNLTLPPLEKNQEATFTVLFTNE